VTSRAWRVAWLAAWVALTAAAMIAFERVPWRTALAAVAGQRLAPALLAVALNLCILPLWALEWRRLAPARERPRLGRAFEVVALTSTTLNTVPFFAGEAAAVLLLVGRAGLSRAGALSVLALDQWLVGIAKLSVIAAAAVLGPIPGALRSGVLGLFAVVTVASLLLVLLAWSYRAPELARAHRPLIRFVQAWAARLEVLRDLRGAGYVVALALAKKGAEIGAIIAAQHALGIALPWWSAVLVVAALGIGTLVPLAPANLGTYEATAFLVYRFLGVPTDVALGLALAQHLYFLVPAIGTGWLLLLARQLSPRLASTSTASGIETEAAPSAARS
jgi:uncharacterized membrane protein YbhN (UPF0104 family)